MPGPELRIIQGEDSPINRFKSFVLAHTVELEIQRDVIRLGTYSLKDPTQLVPIDEVEFKVMNVDEGNSYYIKLNVSNAVEPTAYEVWYDDDSIEPHFYNLTVDPISEAEATQLVTRLTEAEAAGQLNRIS